MFRTAIFSFSFSIMMTFSLQANAVSQLFCASNTSQLQNLLRQFQLPSSWAENITGNWSKSSKAKGINLVTYDSDFYFAIDAPIIGRDAQPMKICKKTDSRKSEFSLVTTVLGSQRVISIDYSGGSQLTVGNGSPIKGVFARRAGANDRIVSDFQNELRRATQ